MRIALTLITVILFLFTAQAQRWSCINNNDTLYFLNTANEFKSLTVVDSSVIGDTVVYKVFRTLERDAACNQPYQWGNGYYKGYNSNAFSWGGGRITKYANGDFHFFNAGNDTLMIKTLAGLNETWVFYRMNNAIYITATVTDIDTMTINGQVDFVKTILLRAYSLSIPEIEQWDYTTIRLSASHGLLDAIGFRDFPEEKHIYTYTPLKPLSFKDVYNLETGDYYQIKQVEQNLYYSLTSLIYHEVLDKTISNNGHSVTYTMLQEVQKSDGTYYLDTVIREYHNLNIMIGGGVPDAIQPNNNGDQAYPFKYLKAGIYSGSNTLLSGLRTSRVDLSLPLTQENDTCWYEEVIIDGSSSTTYYECLGALISSGNTTGDFNQNIVYYNLCGITAGTKQFVGIENILQQQVKVYPNPANTNLTIANNTDLKLDIQILNLQGQVALSENSVLGNGQIDVSTLSPGLYLLAINTEQGSNYRKIIIER